MTSCEVCEKKNRKYRCPGCGIQTCSLTCVKQHKIDKVCDGVRNKTDYVAIKDFTDMNLLSDYRLLEDIGRKTSTAVRDPSKRKSNIPPFLIKLMREAGKRGIQLKVLPYPMSKRKNNNTFVTKNRTILWQSEWIFPQAKAKYTDKRTSEYTTLRDILRKYLDRSVADPVVRHRLKVYSGLDDCRLFMKVEGRPANSILYHELNLDQSLSENLRKKCIIEFPTIFVVQHGHTDDFPLLTNPEKSTPVSVSDKSTPRPISEEPQSENVVES